MTPEQRRLCVQEGHRLQGIARREMLSSSSETIVLAGKALQAKAQSMVLEEKSKYEFDYAKYPVASVISAAIAELSDDELPLLWNGGLSLSSDPGPLEHHLGPISEKLADWMLTQEESPKPKTPGEDEVEYSMGTLLARLKDSEPRTILVCLNEYKGTLSYLDALGDKVFVSRSANNFDDNDDLFNFKYDKRQADPDPFTSFADRAESEADRNIAGHNWSNLTSYWFCRFYQELDASTLRALEMGKKFKLTQLPESLVNYLQLAEGARKEFIMSDILAEPDLTTPDAVENCYEMGGCTSGQYEREDRNRKPILSFSHFYPRLMKGGLIFWQETAEIPCLFEKDINRQFSPGEIAKCEGPLSQLFTKDEIYTCNVKVSRFHFQIAPSVDFVYDVEEPTLGERVMRDPTSWPQSLRDRIERWKGVMKEWHREAFKDGGGGKS